MALPTVVRDISSAYLDLMDARFPGRVDGLYLVGSLCFGEFHPGSDIDFVTVLGERPDPAAVGEVLAEVVRRWPKPHVDGCHLVAADLAGRPEDCPDVPCSQNGRFEPAARFGLNPVTWHELARHGVAVRGAAPDVRTDDAALRSYSSDNLTSYWRPMLERATENQQALVDHATMNTWITEWLVLGIPRLHHLLATGELTSKDGAGRFALATFDRVWHPIIEEALRIRAGGADRGYGAAERVADAITFSTMALDTALAIVPVDN